MQMSSVIYWQKVQQTLTVLEALVQEIYLASELHRRCNDPNKTVFISDRHSLLSFDTAIVSLEK
jgi:hypothetical protein